MTSSSFTRNLTLMGAALVLTATSTAAFAVSRHTAAAASSDVRQLLRMMDKDENGSVSKEEFMQFMSQTFDRLDIDRSGQLESKELRPMTSPSWAVPAPGQQAQ